MQVLVKIYNIQSAIIKIIVQFVADYKEDRVTGQDPNSIRKP